MSRFNSTPNIVSQVLLKEPLMAFRYHFSGNRPTNRIDRVRDLISSLATVAV